MLRKRPKFQERTEDILFSHINVMIPRATWGIISLQKVETPVEVSECEDEYLFELNFEKVSVHHR